MRLIDADKIKPEDFYDRVDIYECMEVIHEQPTAFDVEAVINKLEMFKQRHIEKAKRQGWKRWDETCNAACYAMAIKIIKAYAKEGDLNECNA